MPEMAPSPGKGAERLGRRVGFRALPALQFRRSIPATQRQRRGTRSVPSRARAREAPSDGRERGQERGEGGKPIGRGAAALSSKSVVLRRGFHLFGTAHGSHTVILTVP